MQDLPPGHLRVGSPRLTEDEWTLLLDLYLRRKPESITQGDAELRDLSQLLAAATPGAETAPSVWRSPDGLRARLSVFRVLDPEIVTVDTKRARTAARVWNRYRDAPDACRREAELIRARMLAREPANPDWTWDETVLALAAFLRIRPRYASAGGAEVTALSETLRELAQRHGVLGAPSYRNPAGVARKINKFRAAERGDGPDRVRGARLEGEVWARFAARPKDLALAEAAIVQGRHPVEPAPVIVGPVGPEPGVAPSRGPRPNFGPRSYVPEDGETCLYLLRLHGPLEVLYPTATEAGLAVIKIGRSNDVARRVQQLSSGFPPGCGLEWRVISTRLFPSADAADAAEQWLLNDLFLRGLTLGGEFAQCPTPDLPRLLSRPAACAEGPGAPSPKTSSRPLG